MCPEPTGELTDDELFRMLAGLKDLAELNETTRQVREIAGLIDRCAPVTELLQELSLEGPELGGLMACAAVGRGV